MFKLSHILKRKNIIQYIVVYYQIELVHALSKIYECSVREATNMVVVLDNDDLEDILYKAGYQDKEVINMFK